MCPDRDQPEVLCSRSDSRYLAVRGPTAGGCLTHYCPREVRYSIYRYKKINIDYRSKFSYRFISSISIIYGNTTENDLANFLLVHLTNPSPDNILAEPQQTRQDSPPGRQKVRISYLCHERIATYMYYRSM